MSDNPETSVKDPLKIIEAMGKAKVLVIGDMMLDRFVYGRIERISPESPVPILALEREDSMPGGAGNALANLAGLGTQSRIIGLIGDDREGGALCAAIQKLDCDSGDLLIEHGRPTIVKTRFLAGHQQLLRTDSEYKCEISPTQADDLCGRATDLMKQVQAVLLSDYGKGLLTEDLIARLISAAREKALPVLADPKGRDFSRYRGASVITPNKKELHEATGLAVESDEDIRRAAMHVIETCNIDAVVATRSKDGMSVIQKSGEPLHLRSGAVEVYDVSGAGDTVIATISAVLAAGGALNDAAYLANLAAGIVVAKVGTAPVRAGELRQAVDNDHQASFIDWNGAAEQVRRWRARGLKIGFTNGCFDILHLGHVSYLNDAARRCDRLVVGLNRDFSVRMLKGEERPIHDETSRAAVLRALRDVDMVVPFGAEDKGDDNTANALIELLEPDIYFKGGDYTEDQIPEAPAVKRYGGEVCIMPVYEGHSTSGAAEKIKRTG